MSDLYPGIAHNVRMPSHIDIRIGHWNEALSANLMQAGHFAEAEQVYREDLGLLPENGWSLYGLTRSLKLQHKTDEAAMVDARFQKVWSKATVNITSSCFCQPGI